MPNFSLIGSWEVGHFLLLFFRPTYEEITTERQDFEVNIRDLKTREAKYRGELELPILCLVKLCGYFSLKHVRSLWVTKSPGPDLSKREELFSCNSFYNLLSMNADWPLSIFFQFVLRQIFHIICIP